MLQPRTKVLVQRVSGTVLEMKAKFGWIQPDMPIGHPDFKKRGGRIFLSSSDLDNGMPMAGDKVTFLVYTDGSGLGAMSCRLGGDGLGVQKVISKGPLGPSLAALGRRESLGEEAFCTGRLQTWNGTHGWIVPLEPIQHPAFKGKVYLKATDVDCQEPVAPGTLVHFYLYLDSQGLGAEHCTVADPDVEEVLPGGASALNARPKAGFPSASPPRSPSAFESEPSSVLKAKPKMQAMAGQPESSVLKAKPKMQAGASAAKATTVALPSHLSEALSKRLVLWMWDKGG